MSLVTHYAQSGQVRHRLKVHVWASSKSDKIRGVNWFLGAVAAAKTLTFARKTIPPNHLNLNLLAYFNAFRALPFAAFCKCAKFEKFLKNLIFLTISEL